MGCQIGVLEGVASVPTMNMMLTFVVMVAVPLATFLVTGSRAATVIAFLAALCYGGAWLAATAKKDE